MVSDRPNKNQPKVSAHKGKRLHRPHPGHELLRQYNLSNPVDIFRLLERFGYNAKWCSESCGRNPQWMAAMLKRLGLQEEVRKRRSDYKGRTDIPVKSPLEASRISGLMREEELAERAGDVATKVEAFLERCREEEIETALVNSGGCIADAARLLGVEYHILLRLVNQNANLMDAKDRGEEEFHLEAKDMVLQCVRGARQPKAEQSKWLMFYAKAKLGMADQVNHTIVDDSTPIPTSEPTGISRPKIVSLSKDRRQG